MSTMIPREIGDVLEFDYKKGQDGNLIKIDAEGAGSKFNCLVAKIKRLMLIKNVTSFCIYSGIDILVPENNGVLPYMIIGRDIVFPRYDVTFHERRQKITFTK